MVGDCLDQSLVQVLKVAAHNTRDQAEAADSQPDAEDLVGTSASALP